MLSIAGSDSGGGAGIQADLKAFARCGVHGMTAITAVTAQNTVGVSAVHAVPPEVVLAQIRAVVQDIGVDAVKIGMLGNVETTLAVAHALDELPAGTPVVVDPVMVAESGARLLESDAQHALVAEILPRATVLTPNVPEAQALVADAKAPSSDVQTLTGEPAQGRAQGHAQAPQPDEDAEARALAQAVLALGPRIVVLTGGHREHAVDLFLDREDAQGIVAIPGERHPAGAAHGSGCTHSAVLAAQLALGLQPLQAAQIARVLAGAAVANGLRDIGMGAGPVDVLDLRRARRS
ncbi:MAG TPA: bifunctional hydroxymethylpyrimidine kinase/phosphomethylpyrimidine kinase [Solirubrobacteraceae bacterium]|nr:bifunctional hydroxymethylpyrimidine kinase/phosphomethylpyrimidine kinase [Solirubrobacteraceae bacterium]